MMRDIALIFTVASLPQTGTGWKGEGGGGGEKMTDRRLGPVIVVHKIIMINNASVNLWFNFTGIKT